MTVKGLHLSEDTKKKMSISMKGRPSPNKGKKLSEFQKKRLREGHQKWISDPAAREFLSKLRLGTKHTEEEKRKIGDASRGKKKWPNGRPEMRGNKNPSHRPEVKLKKSVKLKGRKLSPSQIAGIIQNNKQRVVTRETRIKMSISHSREKSYLWKGGVSFEPYCIKFSREFKERVRAFFNYCCILCGSPQGERRHHVHHVDYNKQTCCDNSKPLFVPLCHSCHTKTNANRQYWACHFTEIINGYYEGKCYLSKEEFLCLAK